MAGVPEDTDDEDDALNNPIRDEYLVTTLTEPITIMNIINIAMPLG